MSKFNQISKPNNYDELNLIVHIRGDKLNHVQDEWNFHVLEYYPEIKKVCVKKIIQNAKELPYHILQGEVKFFSYKLSDKTNMIVMAQRSIFSTVEIFVKFFDEK